MVFVRERRKAALALGLQLFATNAVELSALFARDFDFPPVVLYNFYLILDLTLTSWMLISIWSKLRTSLTWCNLGLLVAWVLETAVFGWRWFNIIFLLLSALVLCISSSVILWRLSQTEVGALRNSAVFWILLSLVLYFGGIAPIFSSFNYLARHQDLMSEKLYWIVRALCAVRYIGVAAACYLLRDVRARTIVT